MTDHKDECPACPCHDEPDNVVQLRPPARKPSDCEIQMHFNCQECYDELPPDTSPQEYQLIDTGWTTRGFQVWCRRHDRNIVHIDFEGVKHPAV